MWRPIETTEKMPPAGVEESLILDFKRDPYGASDSQKREIARDVAQFANAFGGSIIIGAEEDGSDRLAEFVGIDDVGLHEQRIADVCASTLAPRPELRFYRHHVVDARSVLVVNVRPFPGVIGAQLPGTDRWEFPIRDGKTRRFLRYDEVERMNLQDRRVRLMFEKIEDLNKIAFTFDADLKNINRDGWSVEDLREDYVVFLAPNGVRTYIPYAFVRAIWPRGSDGAMMLSARCTIVGGSNHNPVSHWR